MGAPFKPRANTIARLAAVGLLGAPFALITFLLVYQFSPLQQVRFEPLNQPIEFDHRHHAGDDAIDCRYCHDTVMTSAMAGVPAVEVCLNCHAQIWNRSPILAPLREAYFTGQPIPWNRVHRLEDYAFFNHAIHVNKGVGCITCHGRVDLMPAIDKVAPLSMVWCLDCHRNPAKALRPLDQITSMSWHPSSPLLAQQLMVAFDVKPRTSCDTCHR